MCEHARSAGLADIKSSNKSPSPALRPEFPPTTMLQLEGSAQNQEQCEATTGGFYRRVYPSIRNLFSHLQKALSGVAIPHTQEKIASVADMLEALKVDEKEWADFARFDGKHYTRNLIAHDEAFTVLLLCWNKSQRSPIHDHAGSSCWVKCLKGKLRERRFAMPDESQPHKLDLIGDATVSAGEVCYINDSQGIHEMGNPTEDDVTVTMHIYCPAYYSCSAFCEETGSRRCVSMLAAAAPLREVLGPNLGEDSKSSSEESNSKAAAAEKELKQSIQEEEEQSGGGGGKKVKFDENSATACSGGASGDCKKGPPVGSISLPEFIGKLDNPSTTEAQALNFFTKLHLGKAEWSSFVHFSDYRFQRLMLHSDHRFSLLMLCWLPGQATPPHNHRGSKSWVRVLAGELFYHEVDDETGSKVTGSDNKMTRCMESPFVEDDALATHVVGNNTDSFAVSLHLYTPPYTDLTYTDSASMKRSESINEEIAHNLSNKSTPQGPGGATTKISPVLSASENHDLLSSDPALVKKVLDASEKEPVREISKSNHSVIPYTICQQALNKINKNAPVSAMSSAALQHQECGCKLLSNFFVLQEKLGMAFASASSLQDLSVEVLDLLEEQIFSPQELEQYWKVRDRIDYRVRLHDSECFSVSLNLWNPEHESVIHDHDGALSWMKVLDGSLMDTLFAESGDGTKLEESHTSRHTTGTVTFYGSNAKHALHNMHKSRRAISLHVYCARDCCEGHRRPSLVQWGTQQACRWYSRNQPKQPLRVMSVTAVEDTNWLAASPNANQRNWMNHDHK